MPLFATPDAGRPLRSGIDVTATLGEDTLSTRNINFRAVDDAPGYGLRATFTFLIPKGSELPQSATLFDVNNKQNQAALDLSGLTVEE